MKNIILIIFSFFAFFNAKSQITTDPQYPFASQSVTIYFDATGTGLQGYSGDVYAHTGVILEGNSAWQHVIGSWGENSSQPKLTKISADHYKFEISPSINSFYSIPTNDTVKKMAFVFRSSDGKQQTADLFVDVYPPVLSADFSDLSKDAIYSVGDNVPVKVVSLLADTIELFVADTLYAKVHSTVLDTVVPAKNQGQISLKARVFNQTDTVNTDSYFFVRKDNVIADLPANMKDGINYVDNSTVVLVLYAPDKKFVFLKGDFNNWTLDLNYQMNKTSDGKRYWLELKNLTPKEEYAYQYYVDGEFSVADPYCDKILDPWNDKYISNQTYPNLKPYPIGKTQGIVSVFQTDQTPYNWKITNFKRPKKQDLIIYELLIRDFVATHSYQTLIDTIGYLKNLGINAIELMPISEFEGNESWGYNPDFYFAPDKYYGTKNKLKQFIDVCHQNGIAVIQDIVLNHSYGQSPLVQLYLNRTTWKVTPENPWYNVNPPNPVYNWGYDFNHASPDTRRFVDRVLAYWLTQYKIDGYRFDFSKGFTNTPGDGWAYDAARIGYLKHYYDTIEATSKNAYLILEHFCENSEEQVLSNYGMMLWGNLNNAYCQASMGYSDGSDFSSISYKNRNWTNPFLVGYMESHDEQRVMYKNITWGNSFAGYNVKNLNTALKRMELSSVFFFTIPGPKMMWQFMETGYDISIDDPCRVCNKPILWNYFKEPYRHQLYSFLQNLIDLRKKLGIFETSNFTLNTSDLEKQIVLRGNDTNMVIIGNFDVKSKKILADFTHSGTWYEYYSGEKLSNTTDSILLEPGEFRIYTDVKLATPTFSYAPQIRNLSLSGNLYVNSFLSAKYDYFDMNKNPEGNSIYKWYSFKDKFGNDMTLSNDTNSTYELTAQDNSRYISVCVQPVAKSSDLSIGIPATSNIVGPVAFNGQGVLLYPNPSHGLVVFSNTAHYNNVIVSDMTGKIIDNFKVNGTNTISRDYSKYTRGIYFVKFISDTKFEKMKFIKY